MILPIMWNLKKYTNKLTYKTEIEKKKNRNRPTDIEKKVRVTKGERGGRLTNERIFYGIY